MRRIFLDDTLDCGPLPGTEIFFKRKRKEVVSGYGITCF